MDPKKADVELIPQIENFVKKIKQTIVYIDCFDQISVVKGFGATLGLIKDIKRICQEHHSTLLLSIDLKVFEGEQRLILEKEFLEVK